MKCSGPTGISKINLYADDSQAFMNEVRRHL
jgi:fructose/tagatose bisphosphate aldolase